MAGAGLVINYMLFLLPLCPREDKQQAWRADGGRGGKGRSPADCWGRCPEQCVPSPREACAPGRATCSLGFRGLSRLCPGVPSFRCPLLSSARAPSRLCASQPPAQAAQPCVTTLLPHPGVLQLRSRSTSPPAPLPSWLPFSSGLSLTHSLTHSLSKVCQVLFYTGIRRWTE